jgi:recombinational DNA repair protein (RecF pathway)
MPNEGTNPGVLADSLVLRPCARCGERKPPAAFYSNPASICKRCQNRASRFSNQCRRAALAHLIALHPNEYRRLLAAERARRDPSLSDMVGGGQDAA